MLNKRKHGLEIRDQENTVIYMGYFYNEFEDTFPLRGETISYIREDMEDPSTYVVGIGVVIENHVMIEYEDVPIPIVILIIDSFSFSYYQKEGFSILVAEEFLEEERNHGKT